MKPLFIHATDTAGARRKQHDATGPYQQAGLAPFRVPRPWETQRPTFATDDVDELLDFFEQVDTIIKLGNVRDEQDRKHLLMSYLPVSKRTLWRGLETYQSPGSYAAFVTDIRRMFPELAEQENGKVAELEKLCRKHEGLDGSSEGGLLRFGWAFGTLVRKLQRAPAILTNRDACRRYLEALDSDFAKRVRAAVLERAAGRIAMEMAGLKLQNVVDRRREDTISLEDLMSVAETVSRQRWTHQQATTSPASPTTASSPGPSSKMMPEPSRKTMQQRGSGPANSTLEFGLRDDTRPKKRKPKPAVLSVFAGETGAAGDLSHVHGEGDGWDQYDTLLTAGLMHHGPETSSCELEQRGLGVEIQNLRRILEDVREELDWTTNQMILVRTELETSKTAHRNNSLVQGPAPTSGFGPDTDGDGQRNESGTVYHEIRRIWATLGRLEEEEMVVGTKGLRTISQDIGRVEDRHSRLEDRMEELREQALGGAGLARDELKLGERRLGAGIDAPQGTVAALRESVAEMDEAVGDIRGETFKAIQDLRDELFTGKARFLENNAPGQRFPNSSGAVLLQNWLRAERNLGVPKDRRESKSFAPLLTKKQKLALERAEKEKSADAPQKPKRGKRGRSKRVPETPEDAGLANESPPDELEMVSDSRRGSNAAANHIHSVDDEFGAEVEAKWLQSRRLEEESRSAQLLDPTRLVVDGLGEDSDMEDIAEIDVLFDAGLDVDEMGDGADMVRRDGM
uniref:Uncharacterized protein n=1 Tax=Mycena chlorophos TaxID=658473 RepID=A0ABQ0L0P1_MYCCL|nr:predicted protein [Mycena chlorophos]